MTETLEKTGANGIRYQFTEYELFRGYKTVGAFFWDGKKWAKMSSRFSNLEEVKEWMRELDERVIAEMNAPKVKDIMPAEAYYSITGYYGD